MRMTHRSHHRTGHGATHGRDAQAQRSGRRPARSRLRHVSATAAIAVAAMLLLASVASADTPHGVPLTAPVDDLLTNIRNWLMGILAGLATVFLTVGGVRYVLGAGDPSEIERAKTSFRAAGLGYALAALAPLVVAVLKSLVGA